jgi:hypothetical protein
MLAAHALDVHGNASAHARHAVAVAKVVSPRYSCILIISVVAADDARLRNCARHQMIVGFRAALAALDAAIQIHGAEGVCSDQVLAAL